MIDARPLLIVGSLAKHYLLFWKLLDIDGNRCETMPFHSTSHQFHIRICRKRFWLLSANFSNLGEYILEDSSVDRVLCFHFLQRLNLKNPQHCHLQDMSSYNDTG